MTTTPLSILQNEKLLFLPLSIVDCSCEDYLRGLYRGSDQSSVCVLCVDSVNGEDIRQWEM